MNIETGKKKRLNVASEFIFNEDGTRDEFVQIFEQENLWASKILTRISNNKYVNILYYRKNSKSVQIQYGSIKGWVHVSSFDVNKDTSKVHQDWLERQKK